MKERESLGRVGEWDGPFSRRVKGGEEVDKKGEYTQMGGAAFGDLEGQRGAQQRPSHVWKCEKEESSTTERVYGPDGGPRKSTPMSDTKKKTKKRSQDSRRT